LHSSIRMLTTEMARGKIIFEVTTMKRLDVKDLQILQMYVNSEQRPGTPSPSIEEIRDHLPGIRSVATVHNRLRNLQDQGLIVQPSHKQPRSRRITEAGKRTLSSSGVPQI
jgi:hypothetical protein